MAQDDSVYLKLIRLPQVKELTGKGRSSIYGDDTFPDPIKIGPRASAWIEHEVFEWINERIRQARPQRKAAEELNGVTEEPRSGVNRSRGVNGSGGNGK